MQETFRRQGFNPWVRKVLWRRKWQPTPVFSPGEPHGWSLAATVHGVAKSQTRPSTHAHVLWMHYNQCKVEVVQSRPTLCSPWKSPGQNTGVGSHSLLQGIFPTQRSNPGLLHCRQILYQLSHKGRPSIEGDVFNGSILRSAPSSDSLIV